MTQEEALVKAQEVGRKLNGVNSVTRAWGIIADLLLAVERDAVRQCELIVSETSTLRRDERKYHGEGWMQILQCAYLESAYQIRARYPEHFMSASRGENDAALVKDGAD